MPDDWNTINIKQTANQGDAASLRARHMAHRDTLTKLAAEAPTAQLGEAYLRLRGEVEASLARLMDAESRGDIMDVLKDPATTETSFDGTFNDERFPSPLPPAVKSGPRLALLGLIALVGVLLFAYFVYRYATTERGPSLVEDQTSSISDTATPPDGASTPQATPDTGLSIDAQSYDFGIVPKGTRKAKSFQLQNLTTSAVKIKISRSDCRCLWFTHPPSITPEGKVTLTVTLDGGRAAKGKISETVKISAQHDPSLSTLISITADVQ